MTEFVIVVEVDHQRAQRAFQKAYDDVLMVWPQVVARWAPLDAEAYAKAKAERDKVRASREAAVAAHAIQVLAYEKAQKALEDWEKARVFNRGPKPARVEYPDYQHTPYFFPTSSVPHSYMSEVESCLARLKKLRDIASAASAPYRMVESDALQMVGWENGEEWQRFINRWLPLEQA